MLQESGLWLVGDGKRLENVSNEEDYRARILKRRPCSGMVRVESKRLGSALQGACCVLARTSR